MTRTTPRRGARLAALATAAALALTACGGDGDDEATDGTDTTTASQADDGDSSASEEAAMDDGAMDDGATDDGATDEGATDADTDAADGQSEGDAGAGDAAAPITTADTDLGEILVTADGLTVYGFTQDEQGGASACTEDCLGTWPPVTVDTEELPAGLDAEVFGVLTRADDGSHQLTADGWPLYTYAADGEGDTQGQGVGEVWFVVAPDGTLIMDAGGSGSGASGY